MHTMLCSELLRTGVLARLSCTGRTVCYASTCWELPFLRVSCIGCSSISC